MTVVPVVPVAHEASDGRIVILAPAETTRVEVRLAGIPTQARFVTRRKVDGGLRITIQVETIARAGTDLELVARRGSTELGRTLVPDVHLLGAGAFAAPATPLPTPAASKAALAIVRSAGGQVGISADCLGTGRSAAANADHRAIAASTLKVAILAAALARDRGSPTREDVYADYAAAIVQSNNDAANRVLAVVGDGSTAEGVKRVNELMGRLELTKSSFDGPYRDSAAPSLKRTSASDLERLARDVYLAAGGEGPLTSLGVTKHEARVLIGLMSSEVHPGLIRNHVVGPVAHKAGWLGNVQNDVALAFGTRAGTCLVGLTTEGLSFSQADQVGRAVAERVLPLLAAPRPGLSPAPRPTATAPSAPRSPPGSRPAAPTKGAPSGNGVSWELLGALIALVVLSSLVLRVAALRRRRQRRRALRARSRVRVGP